MHPQGYLHNLSFEEANYAGANEIYNLRDFHYWFQVVWSPVYDVIKSGGMKKLLFGKILCLIWMAMSQDWMSFTVNN